MVASLKWHDANAVPGIGTTIIRAIEAISTPERPGNQGSSEKYPTVKLSEVSYL